MNTLFIDTHDKIISICLLKNNSEIDLIQKESNQHHSDFVMPIISEILINNNLNVNDINEIIVVNGPGSFTGVRIGVTIAKMMAYTLNIPIKTITSLELYAISSKINTKKLVVIRDFKGVFAGLFNDNEVIGDYFYKSNLEFEKYININKLENNIVDDNYIDFNKVFQYMKEKESINPHQVNPIYIKTIEALKND